MSADPKHVMQLSLDEDEALAVLALMTFAMVFLSSDDEEKILSTERVAHLALKMLGPDRMLAMITRYHALSTKAFPISELAQALVNARKQ